MALGYYSYYALVALLSWVGGFLPLWLEARERARDPARAASPPTWRWWNAVGLALVISPFARMSIGVYFDVIALVQTTVTGGFVVLEPIPRAALWATVVRRIVQYVLVPALGLLLLWDARPTRERLARAGLALREGARRDVLHGLALFIFITAAYVAAMVLAFVVLADVLVSTGDESRVWSNVTPLLIVLLSGVAAVTEEFLFRGLLYSWLSRRMPLVGAALLQAAAFGLVHAGYSTWAHVLGPFAFGLGMAWVVRVLGIVPAMLLHAEINVAFFALDVADVQPAAWGLLVALAALNAYAAWATRLAAVRALWSSLADAFRGARGRLGA